MISDLNCESFWPIISTSKSCIYSHCYGGLCMFKVYICKGVSLLENGEPKGIRNLYTTHFLYFNLGFRKSFSVKLVKPFPFDNYMCTSIYPTYHFITISLKLWLCINTNLSHLSSTIERKLYFDSFLYLFPAAIQFLKTCVANAGVACT